MKQCFPKQKKEGFYHQFNATIQREFHGDDVFSLLIGLDYLLQKDVRVKLAQVKTPFY